MPRDLRDTIRSRILPPERLDVTMPWKIVKDRTCTTVPKAGSRLGRPTLVVPPPPTLSLITWPATSIVKD